SVLLTSLRALAASLPPETPVPVPAGMLRDLLEGQGVDSGSPQGGHTPADPTVAELAVRFGRSTSTIRGWLDRGLIPGAYRFQKREWRVPAAALAAFEAQQRVDGPPRAIAAPRAARAVAVDLRAWRSA
ncbi:MAG: helix-turn-helix domain-containing protein, partial [Gemmatimonadales bacterium]|nr:helix-turn-helix domain-containing protein [Gemmatimonadales bacterium]